VTQQRTVPKSAIHNSQSAIQSIAYTEYHPRWYRRRISTYWWIRSWAYLKFTLRELTSIFVAYFVVLTLLQIRALNQGPEAYAEFQEWLKTPLLVALNTVSFGFVLFHTITWFNLTPKAMPLRLGGKRIPDVLIAAPNYVAWLAISTVVAWFLLGE
jgi:fumarate reductase subunit C